MHNPKKHASLISKSKLRLFFTGFSMGLADLVPGVSGGTVAFLYGIYDELLFSIRIVTGDSLRLLLKGKLKQCLKTIPFDFLIPVLSGIAVAIFGFVGIVTLLLDKYPVYVWSLFFGLVIGSVLVVSKRITKWNARRALLLITGIVFTYFIVGLPTISTNVSPLVMFFTGAIASCAMILPGISGSLIMVILGQYKNVINAVSDREIVLLVSFTLGAVVSLALFARFLSWLLRVHHSGTVAFLIGVMIGSLRKVWPWQTELSDGTFQSFVPELTLPLLVAISLASAGGAIVWKLEKLGIAMEHNDIHNKKFNKEIREQHD